MQKANDAIYIVNYRLNYISPVYMAKNSAINETFLVRCNISVMKRYSDGLRKGFMNYLFKLYGQSSYYLLENLRYNFLLLIKISIGRSNHSVTNQLPTTPTEGIYYSLTLRQRHLLWE